MGKKEYGHTIEGDKHLQHLTLTKNMAKSSFIECIRQNIKMYLSLSASDKYTQYKQKFK